MGPCPEKIRTVLEAALAAVDPVAAVAAHLAVAAGKLRIGDRLYPLADLGRIIVVGGGKAAAPMVAAVTSALGPYISAGVVNTKYGHTAGSTRWHVSCGPRPATEEDLSQGDRAGAILPSPGGPIAVIEAGHPVPDAAGEAGTRRILALLANLTPRDLVIVLLSGGGSALLPAPARDISLGDLQALTNLLLRSGAAITEINAVRKHCSLIQGGQLVRRAAPAQVATLILSDVVGTPLDAIASGPTVPDRSRFDDALAILQRYGVLEHAPASVRRRLEQGAAGAILDTPKPGDPLFERVNNVVVGDNAIAARAAVTEARRQGWSTHLLTTYLQGEAREAGRFAAGLAQGIAGGQSDWRPPTCLVMGGETTVTLRGSGKGGRNQELALAAAIALDEAAGLAGFAPISIASLATDGNDGPTDAAGGLVTQVTIAQGRALGLDAYAALANNDSYSYLARVGSLILTGPTNTNVNDLVFVFCDAPAE